MNDRFASEHAWADLAAPFALDALEEAERQQFEAHLAQCERCRREVDELRESAGLLGYAAPPAAPPPALRDRVLAEARAVRPIQAARAPRPVPARAPWLAAVASVLLLLAAGWGYWQERGQRQALQREYAAVQRQLAEREALLGTLLTPDVETVRLAATGAPPSVRLFRNRAQGVVVLTAADLPPAAAGRTYQLWGIPAGGAPRSLGTFNTAPDGRARVVLDVPQTMPIAISAITEEPAGGSPQPTTTPFLVGEWGAAE